MSVEFKDFDMDGQVTKLIKRDIHAWYIDVQDELKGQFDIRAMLNDGKTADDIKESIAEWLKNYYNTEQIYLIGKISDTLRSVVSCFLDSLDFSEYAEDTFNENKPEWIVTWLIEADEPSYLVSEFYFNTWQDAHAAFKDNVESDLEAIADRFADVYGNDVGVPESTHAADDDVGAAKEYHSVKAAFEKDFNEWGGFEKDKPFVLKFDEAAHSIKASNI